MVRCGQDEGERVFSRSFIEETIEPILKGHFERDEFLGRINEILYFLPFNERELKELTMKELKKWDSISREQHEIELLWDDEAVNVVKDGYNFRFGARSIQHEVEKRIINQIARVHEHGHIERGSTVQIKGDSINGTISIEVDNSKVDAVGAALSGTAQRDNVGDGDTKKWFW